MRRTWRQVVLLVAGLLGTLAICVISGVAGFHLTTGVIGPQVANNFVVTPVVLLVGIVVGIGCDVLGLALAGALFLTFGVGRHLMGPGRDVDPVEVDALDGDQLGVLGLPSWSSPGERRSSVVRLTSNQDRIGRAVAGLVPR